MNTEKDLVIDGPNGKPIVMDIFPANPQDTNKILVFCHGYKGFKDWGPWNVLSDVLMRSGITVVKFNFSFNGGTIEQPVDFPDLEAFGMNNYSKELDDLEIILDFIQNDIRFESRGMSKQIILMGHSRGGGIACLKSANDQRVDMLITLAGVSDFESRFNIGSEEFVNWKTEGIKFILNGRTKQQMPHYFQFYEDFVKNSEKLNIQTAVKSLDKPYLIIHGNSDKAVDIKEAQNLKSWNPSAKLVVIEGADHVFGSRHPWNEDHLSTHLQEATNHILSFIQTHDR